MPDTRLVISQRVSSRTSSWDWRVKSRWLGLRRPIYYWALDKHLTQWRNANTADHA